MVYILLSYKSLFELFGDKIITLYAGIPMRRPPTLVFMDLPSSSVQEIIKELSAARWRKKSSHATTLVSAPSISS